MTEHQYAATLEHHDKRLGHIEDTLKETTGTLRNIGETLARLEAHKPFGAMQIMQFVVTVFVMVGLFVGGVSYITNSLQESRMKLMEYKIEEIKRQQWVTSSKKN